MKFVYLGNVRMPHAEDTYCPRCGTLLIERDGFTVATMGRATASVHDAVRIYTWCRPRARPCARSGKAGDALDVEDLLDSLSACYDVDGWWPAESEWEVMVGALLVQQTMWENVEKVLSDLKCRGLMDVQAIASMPLEDLQEVVRPAGFYRQKASRIQNLARHIVHHPPPTHVGCWRRM